MQNMSNYLKEYNMRCSNLPLVSILIPIYGVEKYIERCAISLFEQTYNEIEYVFVDDCTKDKSIDVLKSVLEKYPARMSQVKIVRHAENRGLAAARNTALDNAAGDYLMHVDGDDYLELNAVKLLVDCALKANADIVACDSFSVYSDKKLRSVYAMPQDKREYIQSLLEKKISPCIWGKLFSTKFVRTSGVRSIEGLNHGEDYATVPRLVYYANQIVHLPVPLYNYVQYNTGAYTKNITQKSIDNLLWADEVLDVFFRGMSEYRNVLILSKLRSKLALLKMGQIEIYDSVANLYRDLEKQNMHLLALKDRILLKMINWHLYRLAYVYSHVGLWLKRNIQ